MQDNKDTDQTATPCQQIQLSGLEVTVKREDLNHPVVQGNKLRKLKYNLSEAKAQNKQTLITFGGAYSNHLLATAFAAKQQGFASVGIVRGNELADNHHIWSDTLHQCQQLGMTLLFVSRSEYREKQNSQTFQAAWQQAHSPYLLPEGGSNKLAVHGMAEIVDEIKQQIKEFPSHILCPVGTGATLAGIIQGVARHQMNCKIYGISVLKGLHSVKNDVSQWLKDIGNAPQWQMMDDYHCGGYAKSTPELERFVLTFSQEHGFELDKIYNSKSFYALAQMIQSGMIKTSDRPLIIHTGGLQGGTF